MIIHINRDLIRSQLVPLPSLYIALPILGMILLTEVVVGLGSYDWNALIVPVGRNETFLLWVHCAATFMQLRLFSILKFFVHHLNLIIIIYLFLYKV